MSSAIFNRNVGTNPYRSGVLIGNYVEDMFGLDLRKRYSNPRYTQNISETKEQFRWPVYSPEQLGKPGNDMTMSCNMNYDLNIDFKRNKLEDFNPLIKPSEVNLNKNIFLPDEIKIMKYQKSLEDQKNNIIPKDTMESQTQNALGQINAKDASNILFTKKTGLSGNLLFGHGDQNKFDKNDLASVNDLCYNQRIRTKEFLGNNTNEYKSTFKLKPPMDRDYMDWGYRKYREYGYFTKKLDKKKKK